MPQTQLVAVTYTLKFDWLVETTVRKDESKSGPAITTPGAPFVMTTGTFLMLRSSADSLDMTELWRLSQMPSLELAVKICQSG